MRVMVTGAQGCIGAWVVKLLLDRGIDVLVYDREVSTERLEQIIGHTAAEKVAFSHGEIEDTSRVKKIIHDERVTHVVHLAAVLMPYCQKHPVTGALIDVIGTLNVFEGARDAGHPVRIVYASSSAVWGPEEAYQSGRVTEEDPLRPSTHYGVFKQANEGNARVFYESEGISSIGLRPWTVYGPGRDFGLTADPSLAIKSVVFGEPFQIRVAGYMDLQYVEDVAADFLACLFSPLEGAHVFNLEGAVISMEDLIAEIARQRPRAAELLSFGGNQIPVNYRMDATALRSKIPGTQTTPLDAGIAKTLEIYERLRAEGRLDRRGLPAAF